MVSDPACVEMIWMGAAHGSIRNLRSAVRHKKQYGRAERSHDRDCRDGLARFLVRSCCVRFAK